MGMYTEIYVNVDLKKDTPPEVLSILVGMCGGNESRGLAEKPARWAYLFQDGSFYTPLTSCGHLTYNEISRQWSLLGKGDIKNYEGEIEQFFEWIMPYIDGNEGDFIGYSRYEEAQEPTLIYLKVD
jgi:hypothetical protein